MMGAGIWASCSLCTCTARWRVLHLSAMRTSIAEQLRKAILTADMSRYALSKASGVSQTILSHFVNRKRTMTVDTAAKLADVLGLELRAKPKRARKAR